MVYTYTPRGTCSRKMTVDVENDIIRDVKIEGGCSVNLQGITNLVRGMNVDEAIERMQGIKCGFKQTSCPDQLAIALEQAKRKNDT